MSSGLAAVMERVSRRFRGSAPPPIRPIQVLVVDDEPAVRNFVARVVGGAGFEIATASNAAEALAIASTRSFDLLLTDLMMPEMYGDELARRLRTDNPDLRVLYLTGFSDLLFADQIVLSDAEAFLDKPCTVNGLLEAVMLAASGHIDREHCHG
jgi:two-component system cell cycle sensor histidine kinase/response regulator CckA